MKKLVAMVMTVGIVATCATLNPMRVEATVTPADVELAEQEEQQNNDVLIQIVHTDLMDYTYKNGKMVGSNPREVVTAYYIVTKEDETIESIANRLEITEDYLLSVNPDYKNPEESFARYAYVELPEIDWHVLTDVYYIVGVGDCLCEISKYFYTDIENLQFLNPKIKDPNLIYAEDIIRVK
ncbi:MAG: LysM peptidoglycan-binding domain-containing protein [Clostridia bacterium]|nr:LysM peptidoglycan-binding domain-containing protein [Clostridia bacterium]